MVPAQGGAILAGTAGIESHGMADAPALYSLPGGGEVRAARAQDRPESGTPVAAMPGSSI